MSPTTAVRPAPATDARMWTQHYIAVMHHTRISDELERRGMSRHFTVVGVQLTPAGDHYRVRPQGGAVQSIDVALIVEPFLRRTR